MMKRKAWALFLLMLVAVGLVAFGTWHCLGWMVKKEISQGQISASRTWPKMLGLQEEQRARLEPLEKELKSDLASIENELALNQMTLCRLTMSETLERKAITRYLEQIGDLQRRKEERMVDHLVTVRQILTPQQQQELFTVLMTDICRGCRTATGNGRYHCGMCKLK